VSMAAVSQIAIVLLMVQGILVVQQPRTGLVSLQIFDATGAPIAAAPIDLETLTTTREISVKADGIGRDAFELPSGTYRFSVGFDGFIPADRQVEVNAGENKTLKITLEVAPSPCDPCGD